MCWQTGMCLCAAYLLKFLKQCGHWCFEYAELRSIKLGWPCRMKLDSPMSSLFVSGFKLALRRYDL